MKQLALERIIVAGWSQSHCEQMFEVTRKYVKERYVFGRKVSDLQVNSTTVVLIRPFYKL